MIREARLSDSNAIAEIIVETWQKAYIDIVDRKYVENMDLRRFIQIMTDNIQLKKEIIYVYEDNGIIKGFISGKFINDTDHQCETVGFYILPQHQRMGIGSKLLQEMEKYFSERDCRKMILWTLKGAKNNSFYKKNGGVIANEKILEIGDGEYNGVGFSFNLTSSSN